MGSVDDKPLLSLITGSLSDPSKYVGSSGSEESDNDVQKRSKFWLESHTLCCVKRSSFHSSAEQTFRMTMPPSMLANNNNENDNFDMVKGIICGESCAYVAINGTINDSSIIDKKQYKTAICRQGKGERVEALPLMSNDQVETIGRCAAQFVNNVNSQRNQQLGGESNTAHVNNDQNDSGWFRSPIKVAKKVSSVINYAIDSALNMYDDGHYFAATGDSLEGEDVDDVKTDNIEPGFINNLFV